VGITDDRKFVARFYEYTVLINQKGGEEEEVDQVSDGRTNSEFNFAARTF
jgi:hypothetical protein